MPEVYKGAIYNQRFFENILIDELIRTNVELEKHVNRRTEELRIAKEASEDALKKLRHIQTQ